MPGMDGLEQRLRDAMPFGFGQDDDEQRRRAFEKEFGAPEPKRNYAGDIASETFSVTAPAPARTDGSPVTFTNVPGVPAGGPSGTMNTTRQTVTSVNPADRYTGGDAMFYNQGHQPMGGFSAALMRQGPYAHTPGLMPPMQSMQAGPDPMMGGQPQGGGFGDAIRRVGGSIMGGIGDAVGWVGENPGAAGAIAGLAGAGANIYAAHKQGEIADEDRRLEMQRDERRRRLMAALAPKLGETIGSIGS